VAGAILPIVKPLDQPASAQVTTPSPDREPAAPSVKLDDLPGDPAERLAIERMVSRGVMRPTSPSHFQPEAKNSLGDFIVSVQRMFALKPSTQRPFFSDIGSDSPIFTAVQAVAPYLGRQILCPGCALASKLLPDRAATRAQAAVILTKILMAESKLQLLGSGETDAVLARSTDAGKIPLSARPYVATAIRADIIAPHRDGTISPNSALTRANTAVLLDNVQRHFRLAPLPRAQ
jgi:hypothetical protein